MIVQTNPMEHSRVASDASLDVHGWAEPGTRITINGMAVPVADDGLFMENVRISRRQTVVVEATGQDAAKRIERQFGTLYESPGRE